MYGGSIAIQSQSEAQFENDIFINCAALQGGAIFGRDFKKLEISNCKFNQNLAYQSVGENIYAEYFSEIINITNSQFDSYYNSIYMNQGNDIYVDNVQLTNRTDIFQILYQQKLDALLRLIGDIKYQNISTLLISDELVISNYMLDTTFVESYFINNKNRVKASYQTYSDDVYFPQNIIQDKNMQFDYQNYNDQNAQLQQSQKQFYQNQFQRKTSGGIHLSNLYKISHFNNVQISYLRGKNGGCLLVRLDQNLRHLNWNSENYQFSNIKLTNCVAEENGGGLYVENIRNMIIYNDNSQISNNQAEQAGGGIFFTCTQRTIVCNFQIGAQITQNKAYQGGGIKWDQRPKFLVNEQQMVNGNQAVYYGDQNASFPTQLVKFITTQEAGDFKPTIGQRDSDYYYTYIQPQRAKAEDPINKTMANKTKVQEIDDVQSGGYIQTQYMALLDEYDQVVTVNNGAKIYTQISDSETQIIGWTIFYSANGVFNISGMEIITTPGKPGIYLQVKCDQQAIQTFPNDRYEIDFYLNVRGCVLGEAQIEVDGGNFICQQCQLGQYLLRVPKEGEQLLCNFCPSDKATCEGSSRIGPKAGYWRKSDSSDYFIKCFNQDACVSLYLNNNKTAYNPTGWCQTGYYGALCSACMPGYHQSGTFECDQCPDPNLYVVTTLGFLLAIIFLVVGLVLVTMKGMQKKSTSSVLVKILLNHFQMVAIVYNFNVKFPPLIIQFFTYLTYILELQRKITSFDCWMDTRDPASVNQYQFQPDFDEMRITYIKLILWVCMPIICGIASMCVWRVITTYYYYYPQDEKDKDVKIFYTKFLSTLVILLFLVHPLITQYLISMFNCSDYDGDLRLNIDPQIICYKDLHNTLSLGVALPGLIIWSIGIPAVIYTLMSKEKQNLETQAAKIRFGFLYNGYKKDNFYWEIIIMYRKILCLIVSIISKKQGVIIQSLLLLILLVGFMQLNNVMRPFANRQLNDIEDLSLLTQVFTIYCGLFFITAVDPSSSSYNPSTDFILDTPTTYVLIFALTFTNIFFLVQWFAQFMKTLKQLAQKNTENPDLYITIFLCGRKDKLEKDIAKCAEESKRETIIEKIEDFQFFIKKMKDLYSNQIYFEGHEQFLQLLYHVETERQTINLDIKDHNFFIQGKVARDRKYDKERIKKAKHNPEIQIFQSEEQRGSGLQIFKNWFQSFQNQFDQNKVENQSMLRNIDQKPIQIGSQEIFQDEERSNQVELINSQEKIKISYEINLTIENDLHKDKSIEPYDKNQIQKSNFKPEFASLDNQLSRKKDINQIQIDQATKLNQNISDRSKLKSTNTVRNVNKKVEKQDISGLESDKEDEEDQKKKKEYKKPNVGDLNEAIKRSRNAKSKIKFQKKTRIVQDQEGEDTSINKKMLSWWPKPEKKEDIFSADISPSKYDEDSPQKDMLSLSTIKIDKEINSQIQYSETQPLRTPSPLKKDKIFSQQESEFDQIDTIPKGEIFSDDQNRKVQMSVAQEEFDEKMEEIIDKESDEKSEQEQEEEEGKEEQKIFQIVFDQQDQKIKFVTTLKQNATPKKPAKNIKDEVSESQEESSLLEINDFWQESNQKAQYEKNYGDHN